MCCGLWIVGFYILHCVCMCVCVCARAYVYSRVRPAGDVIRQDQLTQSESHHLCTDGLGTSGQYFVGTWGRAEENGAPWFRYHGADGRRRRLGRVSPRRGTLFGHFYTAAFYTK